MVVGELFDSVDLAVLVGGIFQFSSTWIFRDSGALRDGFMNL